MTIQINGRHVDVTDSIREYVEDRGKRLFRYFDRIQKVQFTLSREGVRYSAEVVVSAPKGVRLVAAASEEGLQASVDRVVDKVERQITRFKEKLTDKRREEGRSTGREGFEEVGKEEEEP